MRVVAGEFKSRKLYASKRTGLRPTADKVREAVFSILGDVEGATVLDLYCGTGALGIEALSRGAAKAVFVDIHLDDTRRNVADLGLESRSTLVPVDAVRFLRRELKAPFDLVFCDPPYKLATGLDQELDQLIPPALAPGGRVIVESSARKPLRLSLPILVERRYGDTDVRVYAAGTEEGTS
jgi:16S rRNA (guanine966-N2)-methyltransferase